MTFDLTLDDALAYRIHRVSRLLRVHLVRTLAPFSLTPEQYFALFRLGEQDGRSHRELTDPALDDRANITRLVDGLVRRKLVRRAKDPSDGRVTRVWMTDAGRELLERLAPVVRAERSRLFDGLADETQQAVHQALDHLQSALGG